MTLILAGVAISRVAGALTTLALNLSPNPFASVNLLFWLLGSLTDRSLVHVWLAAPLVLAGAALLLTTGRALDALTLGEEAAQNLGVDLTGLRTRIVAGTALSVGAATAVAGTIGFVGLVVPHLLRHWSVTSHATSCPRAHLAAPRSSLPPTWRCDCSRR